MTKIFGNLTTFENPKPVGLIEMLIQLCSKGGDIVLDFFAGSATTGEAVLNLNAESEKPRTFVLAQLPEPCPESSEAFKAGMKTIADISSERIRRVIKRDDSMFQDAGFRYFKLDESNFTAWQQPESEIETTALEKQLELQVDHVAPESSELEILYELLSKAGFKLSEKFAIVHVDEKRLYSIAEEALVIFLGDEITQELLDEVVKLEPIQFICLDKAFQGNDQLKANAVQTFSAHNHGRDKADQIIFRTV
jgi:adenine-specific DNA-methyltransferase